MVFDGLRDARAITAASQEDYNHRTTHSSLGFQTPAEVAAACVASTSVNASDPAAHAAACLGHPTPEPSYRLVQELQADETDFRASEGPRFVRDFLE